MGTQRLWSMWIAKTILNFPCLLCVCVCVCVRVCVCVCACMCVCVHLDLYVSDAFPARPSGPQGTCSQLPPLQMGCAVWGVGVTPPHTPLCVTSALD